MNLLNTSGMAPILLSASDGYLFVSVILAGMAVYFLAPLFSLIFLLSRRGICKWPAICSTAIVCVVQLTLGDRLLPSSVSPLPDLCMALVAMGFWRRIDDRRFGWVSLIWAALTIRFILGVFFFLLTSLVSHFPGFPLFEAVIYVIPASVIACLVGLVILREMSRRRLAIPDVTQLIGYGLVVMLADALFSQAMLQLVMTFSNRYPDGVSIPFNWALLGRAAISGVVGAALAWAIFQNTSAPKRNRSAGR